MFTFREILFGVTGVTVIFWVCVIALWHTYMFPRFFKEDSFEAISINPNKSPVISNENSIIETGALRPSAQVSRGLVDRDKYSRKSFVIADFSPLESDYGVNRLYTSILLSLGAMSFLVITYGLHSSMNYVLPS